MGRNKRNKLSKYHRKERKQSASACKELRAERTDQEQIALLDRKLGVGVGAVKERSRLKVKRKKLDGS